MMSSKNAAKTDDYQDSSVRKPVQSRGKKTREKILKAAADLFGKEGFEKTTTHKVVKAAGVSVGTFYAYFKDKEAILLELFDQHARALYEVLDRPFEEVDWDNLTVRSLIRSAIETSVECNALNPKLHRLFCERSRHPLLTTKREEWEKKAMSRMTELIRFGEEHVRLNDPETAAFIIYSAVNAACMQAIVFEEGPSMSKLVDGLTDLVSRYVLMDADAPESAGEA